MNCPSNGWSHTGSLRFKPAKVDDLLPEPVLIFHVGGQSFRALELDHPALFGVKRLELARFHRRLESVLESFDAVLGRSFRSHVGVPGPHVQIETELLER